MTHTRNYFDLRIFRKREGKEEISEHKVCQRRERGINKGIKGFKKRCTRAREKSLFQKDFSQVVAVQLQTTIEISVEEVCESN